MATVNFRVMQGADRGRAYLDLKLPITIGREEGNAIQLNDERISRFHLKIQEDNSHIVLTDLDSTNGTRVNGVDCQLRILRYGDVVSLGRSTLLYGTRDEIAQCLGEGLTVEQAASASVRDVDFEFWGAPNAAQLLHYRKPDPKIPEKLSPSQAAQLSELLEFFHEQLSTIVDAVKIPENASSIQIDRTVWQLILQANCRISELMRSIADPDS